jgi:hypothetical protein
MAYRERLWPSAGTWLMVGGFGLALGIIPAPVSATAGWITAALGLVVCLTLLAINPPVITVTDGTLAAGRAHVPVHLVADVEVLDADGMRRARGPMLDARAYLCLRAWVHTGARVVLADPDDPTPYWLLASRRPQELALAVRAAASERAANDHASES